MKGKIYIPSSLCLRVLSQYYEILIYPRQSQLEITIQQHLTQLGLTNNVKNHVNNYYLCKICKSLTKNYRHLLPKDIEGKLPQHILYVDLIGLYTITDGASKDYELQVITFIDPVTGWFKVIETHTKTAENIGKLLDRTWLCQYPQPCHYIYDNGNKFLHKKF